ncbi:hypothetical protein N8865_00905 [Francisellaceae bacterium]|nr:hypothetical protein [Francisellaceae bacterium]
MKLSTTLKHPLVFFGLMPLTITVLLAVFTGINIQAEWGVPLICTSFPALYLLLKYKASSNFPLKKVTTTIIILQILAFIIYTLITFSGNTAGRINYPSRDLAHVAQNYWQEHMGSEPVQYASGNRQFGFYLATYLPSKPHYISDLSFYDSPWINKQKASKAGILVVIEGCHKNLKNIPDINPSLKPQNPQCFSLKVPNKFSNIDHNVTLYIARTKY